MRDYHQLIDAGTAAQLEKLKENEHKRGFDDIDINYAERRMSDEADEFHVEAVKYFISLKYGVPPEKENLQAMRREAADIANFAHMIILKCDKELAKL